MALVISLVTGKSQLAILFGVLMIGTSMAVAGTFIAPIFVQKSILKVLEENGGQLEFDVLKQSLALSSSRSTDGLSDVIKKLEKNGLIATVGTRIRLLKEAG